jgi:hypothetical protein
MTRDQVKAILDRVLTWSPQRQQDAAEILALIEEHDGNPVRLTDEQATEVRLRLADRDAKTLTLAELDERLRQLGI